VASEIALIASYWTLAGDVRPGGPSEVSPNPLRDRAEVAAQAGWKGLGIVHADALASVARYGMTTIRDILSDNGLIHNEVEVLTDWHRDGGRLSAANRIRDELLEFGAAIGARNVKVTAGLFEEGPPILSKFRDRFASLCERAAPYGMSVVVEFLPFSSFNTVDLALGLVEGGASNGGVLVDIWHVYRGNQLEYLNRIPSKLLKAVELNDASANLAGTLLDDSTNNRRLCGEGQFDVRGFIQEMLALEYPGPWGVEIISEEMRRMPLPFAAKKAYDTTMAQFESN
jgi:sugar phosphate isomerase/epimerase